MNLILNLLVFILGINISGCMFTDAVSEIGYKEPIIDKIYAFLAYPDKTKLVFVGEKYHYFINPDANIEKFLRIQNKPNMSVIFYDFETDGRNISGSYKIYIDNKSLDKSMTQLLVESGFEERPHDLALLGKVSGVLNLPSDIKLENISSMKNSYELKIAQKPSKTASLTKLIVSPLAIVADVGVVIAGTGIILTAVPVLCLSKGVFDIASGNDSSKCPSGL